MKIFRTVQRQYAILGITSHELTSFESFNQISLVAVGISLFGWIIFSQFMYIFYVATDFIEYMECSCSISAGIIVFICFAAIVLKRSLLFETIDNLEKLIQISENHFSNYKFIILHASKFLEL